MSSRIRGQEAAINITVADEFVIPFGLEGLLTGSFTKIRDFTITPRIDQTEEPYIGETFDDLDQQLHGYDFGFTIDELDTQAVDLLSLLAFKEGSNLPPPVITVSVSYIYREPNILPRTEILMECILKPSERSIGGRKEYIQNTYEGKCKNRQVIVG